MQDNFKKEKAEYVGMFDSESLQMFAISVGPPHPLQMGLTAVGLLCMLHKGYWLGCRTC